MIYGIGDLLKYYADVSVQIKEKLEMLQKEKRIRDKLTKYLRNRTGSMGLTIDSVFNAVENAIAQGDMFYFTVNGHKPCDMLKNSESVDMEIFMNDNYFLTQMALSKFMPSFNLKKKFPEGIEGEKLKFLDWFEREWKKDLKFKGFGNPNFTKTLLEK